MSTLTTIDKLAMLLGGGLIVLGLPVLGFVLTVTGECPLFYPIIRGYLVLLGFIVFMLLGVSKLFLPAPEA
ncbi:hypothetical protein [Halanaeroarchaeum sp. HSR-CO]|uniref:hypothetical protein n=1 Tax=Halanaeroarchaeum sp. HSR-CO TaxID=2866382 RepID=UPI00217DBFB5|nr:hypothetical protein [Halanaeroarchaeum sp. HSR-CO]